MSKMKYIDSWLSGLGLQYLIPKLQASNVTTPKRLAQLSAKDIYEVVGDNEEDRRKISFLIQRLQKILSSKGKAETATIDDDVGAGDENSKLSAPSKSSSPSKLATQNKSSPIRREDYKSEVPHTKPPSKTNFAAGAKDELLRQSTESDTSATLSVATTATDKSDEDLRALRRKRKSTVHSILAAKPPVVAAATSEPIIVKSSSVPVIAISSIKDKANILSSVAAAGANKNKSKPLVLDDNMGIVISSGRSSSSNDIKPTGYNGGPVHGQIISDNSTIVTRGRAHSPIQISPERSNNIRIEPAKRKDLASYINMPGSAPGSPPPAPPLSNSMEFDNIYSNQVNVISNKVDKDMPIRVVVRKRPLSKVELSKGDKDVLEIQSNGVVLVHEPKVKVDLTKIIETQEFIFDDSFEIHETNQQIYNRTIKNLVSFVFDYGKASCFAYGQTGSGKTFTMMGSSPENPLGSLDDSSENVGLYVLAAKDIFKLLALPKYQRLQVTVSCFEIYSGKLFDLLNERSIVKCLEDAKQQVQLPGLTEHPVKSTEELLLLMTKAHTQRSTGSTGANETSSRSHQVMQISVKEPPAPVETNRRKGSISFHAGPPAAAIGGKLSFIDLAGSEKGSDAANSSKQTRLEGAEINTSLLALKEVIRSLERKNGYTPFRGSKLTQVLKDSFVGEKTRTCMIACVSPSSTNCEHTLNTLRYADRVKEHQGSNNGTNSNNNNGNNQVNHAVLSPPVYFPGSSPVTTDALAKQMNGLHIGGPPAGINPANALAAPKPVSVNVANNYASRPPLPVSSNERKTSNLDNKNILKSPSRDVKKTKPIESPLYDQLEQPNVADKLSYTDLINRSVDLLTAHRSSIAEMVEVMKDEMELVQCMENTEDRDVEVYINRLDHILDLKMEGLDALKSKLKGFLEYRNS